MRHIVALMALLPISAVAQSPQTSPAVPPDSPLGALLAQGIVPPQAIPKSCGRTREVASVRLSNPGATIVAFKIEADGSVKDVTLEQSSGSDAMDNHVLKCALGFRYKPATKDGQPVEVPWKLRVNWNVDPR